ncbi:hypothetical protein BJ912DRAFT_1052176 [Pholiota molesta]|nr:hypothetical protein BJ912DRAFT_1052176 [Pholiota molesta]
MAPWFTGLIALSASLATLDPGLGNGFDQTTTSKVRSNLLQIANASWELGTAAEALRELSWPSLAVFNASAIPPRYRLDVPVAPNDVLDIAQNGKPADSLPLVANDGSAADPASIGVAVLLDHSDFTDD